MESRTSRQRAAEEAAVRREAEWAAFRAREEFARQHGLVTAADKRAAETLVSISRGNIHGGRRSPRRSPFRKTRKQVRATLSAEENACIDFWMTMRPYYAEAKSVCKKEYRAGRLRLA